MTISLRVLNARKEYKCDDCGRRIKVGDKYARFFGSPDDNCKNPPPYEMKQCSECAASAINYHEECRRRRTTASTRLADTLAS